MSLEADLLIDRRLLRRKLSVWRVIAFLLAAIALIVAYVSVMKPGNMQYRNDHIARISVEGLIADQTENLKLFDKIADSAAKGVIVVINSPGGTTTGGEALYNGLRKLSAKKPTVAVIEGLGASAAYMAAIGTDHIVARRSSLVGSIGVLVQYPNFSKLLETVGVTVESVKSSPLKAAPDGVTPTSPEATAALAALVKDSYEWFKGLVKTRRGYDDAGLNAVSDGRIFTGKQALDLKLIDAIGDEADAIAWLSDKKGVKKDLPVEDWKVASPVDNLFSARAGAAWLAESIGLKSLASAIRSTPASDVAALDGLVSVWQP